jgi:hypothetical protein
VLVFAAAVLLAVGWIASDAFDWWRRRRGTGKAKGRPESEGRELPRHIRRQRGRQIAARMARAMATEPERLN